MSALSSVLEELRACFALDIPLLPANYALSCSGIAELGFGPTAVGELLRPVDFMSNAVLSSRPHDCFPRFMPVFPAVQADLAANEARLNGRSSLAAVQSKKEFHRGFLISDAVPFVQGGVLKVCLRTAAQQTDRYSFTQIRSIKVIAALSNPTWGKWCAKFSTCLRSFVPSI